MKLGKKFLAILCTVSVLLAMVIIPTSAFTGSTATVPETYTLIDDFENGITDAGTNKWTSVGSANFELSEDYGYGASGHSLKVELGSTGSWKGAKTQSTNVAVENDGLAFWIYLPEGIASGKTFAVNVRLSPGTTTKYEALIDPSKLAAGEHIITIPWSDFALKEGSSTFADAGVAITQIEFTSNDTSGGKVYYLDQLGMYKGEATQSKFIPGTVPMPINYNLIDNFDGGNTFNWQSTNKASFELSAERGYGVAGKSAHISWSEAGWSGFKTGPGQNITLTGDGIIFWAYNAGSQISPYVKLTNANGAYEKQIVLKPGEAIYQIPYAEFQKSGESIDVSKPVTQIEFTTSAAAADYFVDELGRYSNYIASTIDMPVGFTAIEDFNGEITMGWQATNKATLLISGERGYGEDGKSAHVSWSEVGWSGFKTASGQSVTLTGDGIAFWVYNAGPQITVYVKLTNADGAHEKQITLTPGEAVIKIPYAEFQKSGAAIDVSKPVTQIEFTASAAAADYFVDQIGCYADPKKPEVSTVLFDTSVKSSSSAVGGSGLGNKGGYDSVKWKLYDIENDPRFTRAGWFITEDLTSGSNSFTMMNVTKVGTLEPADISSAYYFGNLNFWIKSDTAGRTLKVAIRDSVSFVASNYVEFTVTEANKWQQVTIPVKNLVTEGILAEIPNFLKSVNVAIFAGSGTANPFQYGEEFKIAGLKIFDSDVPDYSEYADLDTEPTQPEDDGSYNADSEIIGSLDFTMNTHSGNPGFGEVTREVFDDFATEQNGIKLVVGDGIRDEAQATKGLSVWFGEDGDAYTVDVSNLEDGYFSMWVRGSRAGMSFYYILMDDTDNDAKTSIVRTYTIKEANTWEEVRIRLCDYTPNGALDIEYIYKISIRTGYGSFNWRYAYEDDQWLSPGDVLEFAAANITEGKPIDPFAATANNGGNDDGDDDKKGSGNTDNGNTGTGEDSNAAGKSPVTGERAAVLWMLLALAAISGLITAWVKRVIKT